MSGDYVERLRAMLNSDPDRFLSAEEEDLLSALDEIERLRVERKELEAVLAEGAQRDRALALLLLRSGGQVEFTLAERVSAPRDGELISYPNVATGGLVLAFQAADAVLQQPEHGGKS